MITNEALFPKFIELRRAPEFDDDDTWFEFLPDSDAVAEAKQWICRHRDKPFRFDWERARRADDVSPVRI